MKIHHFPDGTFNMQHDDSSVITMVIYDEAGDVVREEVMGEGKLMIDIPVRED